MAMGHQMAHLQSFDKCHHINKHAHTYNTCISFETRAYKMKSLNLLYYKICERNAVRLCLKTWGLQNYYSIKAYINYYAMGNTQSLVITREYRSPSPRLCCWLGNVNRYKCQWHLVVLPICNSKTKPTAMLLFRKKKYKQASNKYDSNLLSPLSRH